MGCNKNKITDRRGFINKKEYILFKQRYPKSEITYQNYIIILKESCLAIRDHILGNPIGFKLPLNLGYIAVKKFKTNDNFIAIDWPNTLKYGKRIPLTNFHSFGHAYKIKFYKNLKIRPLVGYEMEAHRSIKRLLAQYIKEDKTPYVEIDRSYFNDRFKIDKKAKYL